jgi:hypothetical protein
MSWRSLRGDRRRSIADSSTSIPRTANATPTFIQNISVNHGSFDILVPQEFLNRADIVVVLQKLRGKAMTKGMAIDSLVDIC